MEPIPTPAPRMYPRVESAPDSRHEIEPSHVNPFPGRSSDLPRSWPAPGPAFTPVAQQQEQPRHSSDPCPPAPHGTPPQQSQGRLPITPEP